MRYANDLRKEFERKIDADNSLLQPAQTYSSPSLWGSELADRMTSEHGKEKFSMLDTGSRCRENKKKLVSET